MTNQSFDIIVIGSGFSGSLTALGLHQIGYEVALIEKNSHPRFAIGESSTPIADMILSDLSERYNLPWLRDFSRYGSWQQTHPHIHCGLKRGFSYYKHNAGQPFRTDSRHTNELLVAASENDQQSDTNWFRSEVDAFFIEKVKAAGISYWDSTQISVLESNVNCWRVDAQRQESSIRFDTKWLIDATGSSVILDLLGIESNSENFRTHTRALFSHFTDVTPWQEWLVDNKIPTFDYPYNPDHSALHHLLDEGWLWMLRFDNDVTSAGLVLNNHSETKYTDSQKVWNTIIEKYPALANIFKDAQTANIPGRLITTNRLQRRARKAVEKHWVALPHTVGFVDPLHSTGIAHSLSGVERILSAFEENKPAIRKKKLKRYERSIFNELDFIDLLADGCYQSLNHFELFHAYSSLYFVASIDYEQKRTNGTFDIFDQFLSADHSDIKKITTHAYKNLLQMLKKPAVKQTEIQAFKTSVAEAIAPYNIAGLLQSEISNMYFHTVAEF